MTEEMGKNVTLTNTIKEMEISYATATSALEQEKLNVTEMVDKLNKEEANHIATKTVLEQTKTDFDQLKGQFEVEKQTHAADVALIGKSNF